MSYRYIGNKVKLLPELTKLIEATVPPGSQIADLMCGTATVSEALKWKGYKVIASDIMTFAVHHAEVRLLIDEAPSFLNTGNHSYEETINYLNTLPPDQGYFYRECSPAGCPENGENPRMYFSNWNASKIDTISRKILDWFQSGQISKLENALLRHDLVLASNRVANIAGTYGHFRSSWNASSLRQIELKITRFLPGASVGHQVLQGRAEDVSRSIRADLCYLDPPYMKRQYAANYHILETIARGDEPDAIGVSGLRPWRDQYSDFCSKLKVHAAFDQIISAIDCPIIFISYSEDGLLSRSNLVEFLEKFGTVKVYEFKYPRFKSNNSKLNAILTEYVFELRKGKCIKQSNQYCSEK